MNFRRTASILVFLLAIAIGAPASFASDKSEVVDAVHRYLDNLDPEHPEKVQIAFTMCDSEISFLDEFPPHEWHGPTACTVWWKGLLAYDPPISQSSPERPRGRMWSRFSQPPLDT
jgi:hypothetical protein